MLVRNMHKRIHLQALANNKIPCMNYFAFTMEQHNLTLKPPELRILSCIACSHKVSGSLRVKFDHYKKLTLQIRFAVLLLTYLQYFFFFLFFLPLYIKHCCILLLHQEMLLKDAFQHLLYTSKLCQFERLLWNYCFLYSLCIQSSSEKDIKR